MSKFNHHRLFNALTPAITLVVLLGASGATLAEETMNKDKVVIINEYKCDRLISVSSHDRTVAIAFLHGYKAGMAAKKSIEPEKLGIISDRLVVHCLDNPTDAVVDAFDKAAKSIKN